MPRKTDEMPRFKNESDEADWWASTAGRAFAKRRSKENQAKGIKLSPSPLLARLNKKNSTQIAIRMPEADIAEARKIAGRKGIGYQTLLKMLVHEGLQRESQRG
jgi:predicted DNA binding CopG/RHH family protein